VTLLFCMLLAVQPRFLGPPEKNPDAGPVPAVRAGDAAPPLSGELENPSGAERRFELAAIVGPGATDPAAAVLIAFFAPGCAGCADELRVVRELVLQYGTRGLRAVVVDLGTDDQQVASRALANAHAPAIPVLGDRWQVWARRWLGSRPEVPGLFVVDRDGTVGAAAGACDAEPVASLRAAIERALGGR
jgi:peroxiredoxin